MLTRRNPVELFGKTGDTIQIISSLDMCKRFAKSETEHLWLIGGASVYAEALDAGIVDEIYLTVVDSNSGADVTLKHDLAAWKLFVLQQEKLGIIWEVQVQYPHVEPPSPEITFVVLRKF